MIPYARLFTLALLLTATAAQAQRISDRTWHGWRGGFEAGLTETFYGGDVPISPSVDNPKFVTGSDANFHLFGFLEKGVSRSFVLGLRMGWDPMSAVMEGTYADPGRIADPQGNVYTVLRAHKMEYILRYITLGGYGKLYPMGGPGLFLGAGVNVSVLTQKRYIDNATIIEPQFAAGRESPPLTGPLEDTNPLRASLDVLIGYEQFYSFAFIAPQIRYNLGFGHPVSASYGDSWTISNLTIGVAFAFPLSY